MIATLGGTVDKHCSFGRPIACSLATFQELTIIDVLNLLVGAIIGTSEQATRAARKRKLHPNKSKLSASFA